MRRLLIGLGVCLLGGLVRAAPGEASGTADEPAVAVMEQEPAAPVASSAVVYVVPIKGMIEPALHYLLRRGVREAQQAGAAAIIFEMDTPGGTLDAATAIVRLIGATDTPSYTYVAGNALSAGAIIALATQRIYMHPGAVIGDAMPILMSPMGGVQELSEDVQEKMVSGTAALIRSAAEQGGHNPELAEAMVRRHSEYYIGEELISSAGTLLTLTAREAEREIEPGRRLLSAGTQPDLEGVLADLGLAGAAVRRLEVTISERIARFIAGLAPLLLIAGLLGLYIEIRTPGFGVPGILGIIALAIFFWGHHIAGLAGMEDLVLVLLGVSLLAIELLFIPDFGITGMLGILLILVGLTRAMIDQPPNVPWYAPPTWNELRGPLVRLALALFGTVVAGALLGRYLPQWTPFRRLVLSASTNRADGYTAAPEHPDWVGQSGQALTDLRPAGIALIDNRRVDVVTQGEFLAAGTALRVTVARGNRIVVEENPA
ncbi:MAG: ATP-dependent Clp protease proteolytic subunit [Candidatus Marinimicrobia bacterium]|nr:ATP-dependent Clp protease proteolytic subunit [Candidatus Neomarinimicrobiota bacterium]